MNVERIYSSVNFLHTCVVVQEVETDQPSSRQFMRWQPMFRYVLLRVRPAAATQRSFFSSTTREGAGMASAETLSPPRNPLILVMGATGTGKSNLALSLAQSLPSGGEIINCDAMQMYRGLPVITNKPPKRERQGIRHHLLDYIELDETPWTANKFVKRSSKVIEEVRARGNIPVVVGGTGYYAFGSLFKDSMLGDDAEGNDGTEGLSDGETKALNEGQAGFEILNASTQDMLNKLKELDPEMAKSWHPNDRRKIQRSLEICLRRGRKVSEIYREQTLAKNGHEELEPINSDAASLESNGRGRNDTYGTADLLRYDAIIFWLSASDQPLKARLNARVHQMVQDGLFEEALDLARLRQQYQDRGVRVDTSKGIWISIGYKEMEPWATKHLQEPDKYAKDSKLARECIESVKAGTRQYAKRQERYIRIRLANALKKAGALDRLFLLDSTDLSKWQQHVVEPAQGIVKKFLDGQQLPEASSLNSLAKENFEKINAQGAQLSYRVAHYCEVCDKTMMTEKEWAGHLASRSHKKTLRSKRRKALVEVDGSGGTREKAQ